MEQIWQFAGSCKQGDPYEVRGVNVWEQGWQQSSGEQAEIRDPVFGQQYLFNVYTLQDGDREIEFAAGEFSNGEWGFYIRE